MKMIPALLTLLALPAAAADQAAGFFDDFAVREIRLYFDDANWYNTLFQSHNSNPADQYGETNLAKIGAIQGQFVLPA